MSAADTSRAIQAMSNRLESLIQREQFDDAIMHVRAMAKPARRVVDWIVFPEGRNWLHLAAKSGHVGLVEALIEADLFEIDVRDSDGTTPLFYAASLGHYGVVQFLVERGADVEARRSHYAVAGGRVPTALIASVNGGYEDVALYLIDHGANATSKIRDAGGRSLLVAIIDRDLENVFEKLLLRKQFEGEYIETMATVTRRNSGKILDVCLGFPPLAETVAGPDVDCSITGSWRDAARDKVMAWRTERAVDAAIATSAEGAVRVQRNLMSSL